jgi:hypothetical protein
MTLIAKEVSTKMSIDEKLNRTYTNEYHVPDVPWWTSPLEVINASGIPSYLSYYTWGTSFDLYAGFKGLNCGSIGDTLTTISGVKTKTKNMFY